MAFKLPFLIVIINSILHILPAGVFNIEGGCYAKVIKLKQESEPEIFNAIRFGTLLENVVFDEETREVDFDDA